MLDASWGVTAPALSDSGDRVEVQNVRVTRAAYKLIHDRIDPESEVASNVCVIRSGNDASDASGKRDTLESGRGRRRSPRRRSRGPRGPLTGLNDEQLRQMAVGGRSDPIAAVVRPTRRAKTVRKLTFALRLLHFVEADLDQWLVNQLCSDQRCSKRQTPSPRLDQMIAVRARAQSVRSPWQPRGDGNLPNHLEPPTG